MKKNILISLFVVLCLSFFLYSKKESVQVSQEHIPSTRISSIEEDTSPKKNTTISQSTIHITAGSSDVIVPFFKGQTLYQILFEAKNSENLSFFGKEYPSLGFFVTDIGTLHQGQGKFLVYFINGIESSVGVSSYFPNDADRIVWELQ